MINRELSKKILEGKNINEPKISPFARKVYRAVMKIPLGEVRTYKWVADRIGRPRSYRAVGQVLKRNPLLFIIPCHRVVGSGGSCGGYILGRKNKLRLLYLERQIKKKVL